MTESVPTTIGSKHIIVVAVALALIVAIGVAVFMMWRKMSASSIENKVLSSSVDKTKLDITQLANEVKNRDDKISDHGENIHSLQMELVVLKKEVEDLRRRLKSKKKKVEDPESDNEVEEM